jgi:hypothetical protein
VLKVGNHVTFLLPPLQDLRVSKVSPLVRSKVVGPPSFRPFALRTIFMLDGLKKSDPIRTNVAITDKIYHMLKMEMCDMVPDVTA